MKNNCQKATYDNHLIKDWGQAHTKYDTFKNNKNRRKGLDSSDRHDANEQKKPEKNKK